MSSIDPLQITSKRPSMQKDFSDVAISESSWISSKRTSVLYFFDGKVDFYEICIICRKKQYRFGFPDLYSLFLPKKLKNERRSSNSS